MHIDKNPKVFNISAPYKGGHQVKPALRDGGALAVPSIQSLGSCVEGLFSCDAKIKETANQ